MASSSRLLMHRLLSQAIQRYKIQAYEVIAPRQGASRSRYIFERARPVSVRREGAISIPEGERIKGGKKDTVWQSFLRLSPPTRMAFGISVAVFAVFGLFISDKLRAMKPAPLDHLAEDGKKTEKPGLFRISVVDRKDLD